MNRTFKAPATPARARLLKMMLVHTEINVDPAILELAEKDRIDPARFDELGITDEIEREGIQFIFDTNFRAGIPANSKERPRADRIIRGAVSLAGIPKDEVHSISDDTENYGFIAPDYSQQIANRKKLLLMDIDEVGSSPELIGKLFPRIILTGQMMVQYSFSFGSSNSTTSRMGKILYPAVEESITRSLWKKNQRKTVMAMGIFPGLLEDYEVKPAERLPFCIPKTVEY